MNVSLEQLQLMLERLLTEKSSLMIDNAVLRERVRELEGIARVALVKHDIEIHGGVADSTCRFCATIRATLARSEADDE